MSGSNCIWHSLTREGLKLVGVPFRKQSKTHNGSSSLLFLNLHKHTYAQRKSHLWDSKFYAEPDGHSLYLVSKQVFHFMTSRSYFLNYNFKLCIYTWGRGRCTCAGDQRAQISLELELQVAVNHQHGCWKLNSGLPEKKNMLLNIQSYALHMVIWH